MAQISVETCIEVIKQNKVDVGTICVSFYFLNLLLSRLAQNHVIVVNYIQQDHNIKKTQGKLYLSLIQNLLINNI
jgi:hypothetical protein